MPKPSTIDEFVAVYDGRPDAMRAKYRRLCKDGWPHDQNHLWIPFLRAMALVLPVVQVPSYWLKLDGEVKCQDTFNARVMDVKANNIESWPPLVVETRMDRNTSPIDVIDGHHRARAMQENNPSGWVAAVIAKVVK